MCYGDRSPGSLSSEGRRAWMNGYFRRANTDGLGNLATSSPAFAGEVVAISNALHACHALGRASMGVRRRDLPQVYQRQSRGARSPLVCNWLYTCRQCSAVCAMRAKG